MVDGSAQGIRGSIDSGRRLVAALALSALAASASAADDVDLQIRGNERVDGTLRPADERESFLIDAPRGARITANVVRRGDGAPTPALDVLDSSSSPVVSATANSKGAKLKAFEALSGDVYRLRVAGDGAHDGDYRFTVKVTARTKWSQGATTELAPGAETTFSFAAPIGATADVALAPGARSSFVPRIVDVEGAGATLVPVDGSGATAKLHRVRGVTLGPTGEYLVRLRNDGAAAGTWTISVRLSVPRIAKTNVDIRDGSLTGSFGGDSEVFGRVVDPTGALVDPVDDGGGLDGASVLVPADAIGAPTVISLQASDTFFVDDKNHDAGVAVSLSPAGTVFATPVTVTLPYDPQAFDDPVNEISIFIEDTATGALEAVDRAKLVIDTNADTVSFPTSHFSRFQGTSPKDRPCKGAFVQLEIGGRPDAGYGGEVSMGLHRVACLKGPRTGNRFTRDFDRRRIIFGSGALSVAPSPAPDGGVVNVIDDENVALASTATGLLQLLRGRDDGVLISSPSSDAPEAAASLLLRVAKGAPTFANVAGAWHAFVFEFSARVEQGHDLLELVGRRTTLDFGIDGAVNAGPTVTDVADSAGAGAWSHRRLVKPPHPGTFQPGQGVVHLAMELGISNLSRTVDLVPVARGDVLVGVTGGVDVQGQATTAAMARTVILVRAGDGAKGRLVGRALFAAFGLAPEDRPGADQDLSWIGDDLVETRDGDSVDVVGTRATFDHDGSGAPRTTPAAEAASVTYSVASDGTYRQSGLPIVGAVAPHAGFYVTTRFGPQFFGVGFGVVGRTKP